MTIPRATLDYLITATALEVSKHLRTHTIEMENRLIFRLPQFILCFAVGLTLGMYIAKRI